MNEIDNRYVELLNQRKTQTNPTQSIGALNVWFKTNGEPYSIELHTANQLLHDIIIYDGEQFICAPTMKRID